MSREVNIGNGKLKKQPNKKVTFLLKDGSVTLDKLALDVWKLLSGKGFDLLFENPLPWFEIHRNENNESFLYAYWADDGCIDNIWLDEATGCIMIRMHRYPQRSREDGWYPVYPRYDHRVMVSKDLDNEACPVILGEGDECTVLYENVGDEQEFTVTVANIYKTPDDDQLVVTVPPSGYAEVNYLKSGGVIFARGA